MLTSGWTNWSWNSSVGFASSTVLDSTNQTISFTPNAWGGLYLHTDSAVDTAVYSKLLFSIYATSFNEKFSLILFDSTNNQISQSIPFSSIGGDATQNSWKQYSIPLDTIAIPNHQLKGFAIQETTGNQQPTVYVSNVSLVGASQTSGTYTTSNGTILKNGQKIVLHGISWFGFETGTHVLDGLWSVNWKDSLMQMKDLGFNAVRIPFCPASLHNVDTSSINYDVNPDLKGKKSLDILDMVLQELNTQHMYILLDHHTPDCTVISDLWYTDSYSENQWLTDLSFIANRYKDLDYFMGVDLKNEPHGRATWGTGNASTDWNTAAEKAGRMLLDSDQNLLVFVQGIQNNPTCSTTLGHWQGGNLEPVNCTSIATSAIPSNKLILSPHVYGPDVYNQGYFDDGSFPNNMSQIWETQFGFLVNKGVTIVPGEWGGKDGTDEGNAKDALLQQSLVSYFTAKHICNSFYWDWNPNSGDTGGILQNDWKNVWNQKMNLLNSYYNQCTQ